MKRTLFILVGGLLILSVPRAASAQTQTLPLVIKSTYYTVSAFSELDLTDLLARLNYNYFLQFENLLSDGKNLDLKIILAKTLDAMYLEIANLLGIKLFDYHSGINILRDQGEVNAAFRAKYNVDFKEPSFYLTDDNTVYIAADQLTLGMLGHELAHALVTRYFVVPPPPKIEEVLSGYVEFKLLKSTGTK